VGTQPHQTVDANTGKLKSVTDPTGATTTFGYDADGNTTSITDANGHTRTATYDAFDRVTSLTDAGGATVHDIYDAAGNLSSVLDRNGQTITHSYDADSRLISKTVPGAGTTTYTYDGFGRRTGAANNAAHLTFTYDDADHMLTATSSPAVAGALPTATFTYTYDAAGNVTSAQGPGGTTKYGYDATSQLATLTDPAGGSFAFTYDQAGRETAMTRPNGVNDATTYDAAGDLATLHSTLGATLLNQADYTYNAAGLVGTYTNATGATTYTYDASNQLIGANPPGSSGLATEQYTYDPAGNRTSGAGSPLGSFSYDSTNRLNSDATNTYTYDKEGNLVSRTRKASGAKTTYTWSAEHQLLTTTYPDNTTSTFRYDPLGRRLEITDGATTTRYAYDGQAIAAEYDDTNALTATYIHHPTDATRTLEMVRSGQRYFYLADAGHSTTALTDANGGVVNTYKYGAFGTTQQAGTIANPFTFTGQYRDTKAGLILFPLRAYDPVLGRFLSEDPQPDAANLYLYTRDDPINLHDPSGASSYEYALVGVANGLIFLGSSREGFHTLNNCLKANHFGVAASAFIAAALFIAAIWAGPAAALMAAAFELLGGYYHFSGSFCEE
jgi:RHS repeat-associated protein